MSAVSPEEIEQALKRVDCTKAKKIDMNEVITVFSKFGIQVKNPDGNFKCWLDILNEMSEIWDKLSIQECSELFKNVNKM